MLVDKEMNPHFWIEDIRNFQQTNNNQYFPKETRIIKAGVYIDDWWAAE